MVLDAAKGIEPQTLKLFEVCRTRGLPVLTFINKLDQPALDPFELLDEIERVLGIAAAPMNWPLGDGADFPGVYDLEAQRACCSTSAARAATAPSRWPWPIRAIRRSRELIGADRQQRADRGRRRSSPAPARASTWRRTGRSARRRCSSAAR